jgi:hypothetical protein
MSNAAMPSPGSPNAPVVACPGCRRQVVYSVSNPWRPFCSERCRLADLGDWAAERFRLPVKPAEGDDDVPDDPV